MLRTTTCGELNAKTIGKKVTLCGWINTRRDHGGLIFIDLRDRYGITQVVINPEQKDAFAKAQHLGRESVLQITGTVAKRPSKTENLKLPTGAIEVRTEKLVVLAAADTPPLDIHDAAVNEEMRLKYRYLDLRRPELQSNIVLRHRIIAATRNFFDEKGFIDIETPILMKSTPEGARDYLVPSRVHPGKFYALPQSPQMYKQLCMIAGMDKYFQIARCFRDEDLRADRQPEFTQLDVEMSFVTRDDIFAIMEEWLQHVFKAAINYKLKTPVPRYTYKEVMEKYGCDKPDLRFGLELQNLTALLAPAAIKVFQQEWPDENF